MRSHNNYGQSGNANTGFGSRWDLGRNERIKRGHHRVQEESQAAEPPDANVPHPELPKRDGSRKKAQPERDGS